MKKKQILKLLKLTNKLALFIPYFYMKFWKKISGHHNRDSEVIKVQTHTPLYYFKSFS